MIRNTISFASWEHDKNVMKIMRIFQIGLAILSAFPSAFGQPNTFCRMYRPGSILYVYSQEGLSLRIAPNPKSKLIQVVPFGEAVKVTPNTKPAEPFTVSNIQGTWVKVRHNEKEGFLFDGLLSRFPPLNLANKDSIDLQNYLRTQFRVKSEANTPPDQYKYTVYVKINFENGISYLGESVEGTSSIRIIFPISVITFQEVFLMARLSYADFFASNNCDYHEDKMSCNQGSNSTLSLYRTDTNYIMNFVQAN